MGCVKLHILDEQYKRTELKVSYINKKLTSNFCAENLRSGMLVRYVDADGREVKVYFQANGNTYAWTFNGSNQAQAPANQFVQDFLTSYNYNVGNGGGESMYTLANSRDMTVNLRDDINNSHTAGLIRWNPRWASITKEGYTYSPATSLEHEMAHALSYLTDLKAHNARVETTDKQYDNKEEMRVITSAEAKTAQANGEFPAGYVRTDHANHGDIRVASPNGTTQMHATTPLRNQDSPNLWDRIKQWFNQ